MVNIGKARNPVNQSMPQLVVTSIKGEAVQDPNIVAWQWLSLSDERSVGVMNASLIWVEFFVLCD